MRICYYADGRYVHTERWMNFFVNRGHEMHLISYAAISIEREQELRLAGIKYHGHTGNFHIKRPWLTIRDLRFVRSTLNREGIEILHSHFLGANIWFAHLSRFHPHIITVMGGDVIGTDWRPNRSLQEKLFTIKAIRNADHITAWSSSLAGRVLPYVAKDTVPTVVHGGVHLASFCPGPRPTSLLERLGIPIDGKVIFSPRLMRPLSNVLEFARAAELIAGSFEDVYFVVASPVTATDEEYSDKVSDVFASGKTQDRVRFVSEISHFEIADYFRAADVVVSIPSTDGTPMTVLESMACGTPTVIGDLPDYDAEYFEDEKTTLMVDVKDPESIANAIIRLLTDQELAERISNEARRRVEETGSYEFQMYKMEAIYQSLIKK